MKGGDRIGTFCQLYNIPTCLQRKLVPHLRQRSHKKPGAIPKDKKLKRARLLSSGSHVCALLSCFSCVHLFVTPWTETHQAPLSVGFSRQKYWSGLACPPPGDLPNQGFKPASLTFPALASSSLPLAPPGKPSESHIKS